MNRIRICKYCGEEFKPGDSHPGLITVCLDRECQTRMRADGVYDPLPLTACVTWSGKHTMEMTIVENPMESAFFNNAQRRFGASVMASLTAGGPLPLSRKVEAGERERESKEIEKLGTRGGDMYRSRLGEARHVKR